MSVAAFLVSTNLGNLKENHTTIFTLSNGISSARMIPSTHMDIDMFTRMEYVDVRYYQHCLKYHFFVFFIF